MSSESLYLIVNLVFMEEKISAYRSAKNKTIVSDLSYSVGVVYFLKVSRTNGYLVHDPIVLKHLWMKRILHQGQLIKIVNGW